MYSLGYTRGNKGIPLSIAEIQQQLNEMDIPNPSVAKCSPRKRNEIYWARSTIYALLKNETYAGTWYFNKRKRINGKLAPRDKAEWLPVNVPAIINRQIFEVTQARLKGNRTNTGSKPKYQYMLNRRVSCSCSYKCGCYFAGGKTYYRCNGRRATTLRNCDLPAFPGKKVDDLVWQWVKGYFEDEDLLRAGIDEYQKRQASITEPLKQELKAVKDLMQETEKELAQNQRGLIALGNSKADRTRTKIKADIELLEGTLDTLEVKKTELQAKLNAAILTEADIQEVMDRVNRIKQEVGEGLDLADASFEDKRWIIQRLNVEATLFIEEGEKMVEANCYFGDEVLQLSNTINGVRDNRKIRSENK